MCHVNNEKQKTTNEGGIELPNQDKIRTLGEKETYIYLWILEVDTIKQLEMEKKKKRKKKKKNTSRERENYLKPNYLAEILSKG